MSAPTMQCFLGIKEQSWNYSIRLTGKFFLLFSLFCDFTSPGANLKVSVDICDW